jgi:hypothetical protein
MLRLGESHAMRELAAAVALIAERVASLCGGRQRNAWLAEREGFEHWAGF